MAVAVQTDCNIERRQDDMYIVKARTSAEYHSKHALYHITTT